MAEQKIILPKISLPKIDHNDDLDILCSIFHTISYHRALGSTTTQEYLVCPEWLKLRYVSSPDLELHDRIDKQLKDAYASLDRDSHQNQELEIVFIQKKTEPGILGPYEKEYEFERWVLPIHFFSNWTGTAEKIDALRDQLREILFKIIKEADAHRDAVPYFKKDNKGTVVIFPFKIRNPQKEGGFLSNLARFGSFNL